MKKILVCLCFALAAVSFFIMAACENDQKIELETDSVTLEVDESMQISANVSDGVTWRSEDPKIVTVDATGAVTGISEGTTTVTASANGSSASCKVTVVPSTSNYIELNYKTDVLTVGDDLDISAQFYYQKNPVENEIVYKSSDSEVAAIEGNTVRAQKSGTATISAETTYNGKTYVGKFDLTVYEDVSIILTASGDSVSTGESVELSSSVLVNGKETDAEVAYSVDPAMGEIVQEDGKVFLKAVRAGDIAVFAEYAGTGTSVTLQSEYSSISDYMTTGVVYNKASDNEFTGSFADVSSIESVELENGDALNFSVDAVGNTFTVNNADDIPGSGIITLSIMLDKGYAVGYEIASVTKVISSLSDLQQLKDVSKSMCKDPNQYGGYYVLGADLVLGYNDTYDTIGNVSSPNESNGFIGVFDGNGHTISNTFNSQLFGNIGANGVVCNLIVDNVFRAGQNNCGSIAKTCYGLIENVLVTGGYQDGSNVGGVVSVLYGTVRNTVSAVVGAKNTQPTMGGIASVMEQGALAENVLVNGACINRAFYQNNGGEEKSVAIAEDAGALLESVKASENYPEFIVTFLSSERTARPFRLGDVYPLSNGAYEVEIAGRVSDMVKYGTAAGGNPWAERVNFLYFGAAAFRTVMFDMYVDEQVNQSLRFYIGGSSVMARFNTGEGNENATGSYRIRIYDAVTGEQLTFGNDTDVLPRGKWVTVVWDMTDALATIIQNDPLRLGIAFWGEPEGYVAFDNVRYSNNPAVLVTSGITEQMSVGDELVPEIEIYTANKDDWYPTGDSVSVDDIEITSSASDIIEFRDGKLVALKAGSASLEIRYRSEGVEAVAVRTVTVA